MIIINLKRNKKFIVKIIIRLIKIINRINNCMKLFLIFTLINFLPLIINFIMKNSKILELKRFH